MNIIVLVHNVNNTVRNIIQIHTRWIRVQTNGMELIAIFHGEFAEHWEISLQDRLAWKMSLEW